ncbi:BlaI/MecI/CopY family transcriptional regulator [Acidobacteria bacterium AH-259-G07]|nr:BlaI/MecI/CopY family transcriptional regulator [Acidobacteria bacterium AH-259-L09]MDA2927020.1 BlaI/MecI/CopY family transcriptional regulator [Acidobacteria bacterium AH-259-G07]
MKFAFRPSKKGIPQVLGELESKVMKEVWDTPGCTAREVRDRLRVERKIAYTTVLTILDRLHKKKLLTRSRIGRAFLYSPALSQQEFDEIVTRDVLEGLLKEDSRPILSTFVELVSADEEQLEELEELVRRKRR